MTSTDAWHVHEQIGCEVVEADFAWFSQTCGVASNIRTRDEDGAVRAICPEHAKGLDLKGIR